MLSAVRMIRAVLPAMRRAGGGAIINVQSTSVKVPLDNLILSNAIRTGAIGLAKTLSFELAKDGIRVNNVLPGAIMTDRQREMLAHQSARSGKSVEEIRRLREAAIPLGRYGDPEDLGNMIAFLASERARYVTGVTVQVDGGMARSLM
jgi:3-oxoacyl-[acyl-carrier protein] reductase